MRVKCLAQEHNKMPLARTQTRSLDPARGHPPPIDATIIVSNECPNIGGQFCDVNDGLVTQELLLPFFNQILISTSSFTFLGSVKKNGESRFKTTSNFGILRWL